MTSKRTTPLVAIPCDTKQVGKHIFHQVGEKYIDAVRDHADVVPILVPATREPLEANDIFSWASGIMFTGAITNVYPPHYGSDSWRPEMLLDQQRDDTTLPLIRAAIEAGLPTLCICRGFQELNVALGGTLHQHVQEVEGRFDHRENEEDPIEVQYGPAHTVDVTPGGVLQNILDGKTTIHVNSLHGQGIDRLAESLQVEAIA